MRRIALLVFAATLGLRAWGPSEDLLDAARTGDLPSVQALIAKGAAIDTRNAYGQTPLYLAAISGREEVVRYLLDKGASADVKDTFYKASMLDFVLQRKHYTVAKMLIAKSSAPPDETLASLAQAGNADVLASFLEKGKLGQTALDKAYAAALEGKSVDVAAVLKKAGANEPAPAVTVDSKTIESYVGTYKSEQVPLDIKAFVKDGKLYMQATGQPEFPLKSNNATQFEFAPAHLEVEFDSPASFTLKQGGASFRFKKAVTQ